MFECTFKHVYNYELQLAPNRKSGSISCWSTDISLSLLRPQRMQYPPHHLFSGSRDNISWSKDEVSVEQFFKIYIVLTSHCVKFLTIQREILMSHSDNSTFPWPQNTGFFWTHPSSAVRITRKSQEGVSVNNIYVWLPLILLYKPTEYQQVVNKGNRSNIFLRSIACLMCIFWSERTFKSPTTSTSQRLSYSLYMILSHFILCLVNNALERA
jgi:hypothetical protein